jgi:predicted methyltransferase
MKMSVALLAAMALTLACSAPGLADDDTSIYAAAVASKTRLEGDYARDAARKPEQVLAFFDIQRGDTVLDMFSGGGYYTELLSNVVGPDGKVVAQSNKAYLGFVGDEFKQRHADGRLANVDVLMAENNELDLAADRFDAITLVLAYHDVYHVDVENGWNKIDVNRILGEFYKALKPGGIVGVVDHSAAPGTAVTEVDALHRIDRQRVIDDFTGAGFVLDSESDVLRNPGDDLTKIVFDPAVRGKTDRFVLRFRKPE